MDPSSHLIVALELLCRLVIRRSRFGGTPENSSILNRSSRGTRSNADVRSAKHLCTVTPCFAARSEIAAVVAIASTVEHPPLLHCEMLSSCGYLARSRSSRAWMILSTSLPTWLIREIARYDAHSSRWPLFLYSLTRVTSRHSAGTFPLSRAAFIIRSKPSLASLLVGVLNTHMFTPSLPRATCVLHFLIASSSSFKSTLPSISINCGTACDASMKPFFVSSSRVISSGLWLRWPWRYSNHLSFAPTSVVAFVPSVLLIPTPMIAPRPLALCGP